MAACNHDSCYETAEQYHALGEGLANEIRAAMGPRALHHVIGGFMSGGGFWDDVGNAFNKVGEAIISPTGLVRGTLLPMAANAAPMLGPEAGAVIEGLNTANNVAKSFGMGLDDGREDRMMGPRSVWNPDDDIGEGFWDDVKHYGSLVFRGARHGIRNLKNFFASRLQARAQNRIPEITHPEDEDPQPLGMGLYHSIAQRKGPLAAHHVLGGMLSGGGYWSPKVDPTGAFRRRFNARLLGASAKTTPSPTAASLAAGTQGTVGGGFWDDVGNAFNKVGETITENLVSPSGLVRGTLLPMAAKAAPMLGPEAGAVIEGLNTANNVAKSVGLGLDDYRSKKTTKFVKKESRENFKFMSYVIRILHPRAEDSIVIRQLKDDLLDAIHANPDMYPPTNKTLRQLAKAVGMRSKKYTIPDKRSKTRIHAEKRLKRFIETEAVESDSEEPPTTGGNFLNL